MARWLLNSCVLLLLAVGSLQARLILPQSLDIDGFQLETKGAGIEALPYDISPRVDDNSVGNYRLPNNTAPEAYDVELWTNVHSGVREFNGTVKIDLQVLEASTEIKLHYRQTWNFSAEIISRDLANPVAIPLTWTNETLREFLTFTPVDTAVSFAKDTNWTLTINYTGFLRNDMGGFYISSYTDDDGTQQ